MAAKPRRITPVVDIAGVKVGGNHAIVVQSMTNTDTEDVASTVNQMMALAQEGSEQARSAVRSAEAAERYGLGRDKIILSAKVSGVQDLIAVYRSLAAQCDYPLHLGLTEAGLGAKGIVATTAALAVLLQEGIGDTIRASLTPLPNGDRTDEVIVSQQILQSLGIRSFTPQVTACPGCGRTTSTFFQDMADQIQTYLRERMPVWKNQYEGVETMQVAVMGVAVYVAGESKHSNIGISLPGTFEEPVAPEYVDGKLST